MKQELHSSKWHHFKLLLVLWFKDAGITRVLYRNFYRLGKQAFRSNQPSPHFIRKLHKKYGIKTIINLRKEKHSYAAFELANKTTQELGIKHIQAILSSWKFPTKEQINTAKNILETAEYPILIHCKAGADRAGLMSTLYMIFIENKPAEEAIKQLSFKYGHFHLADTGKMDFFFETYIKFQQDNPEIDFLTWVNDYYNPEELDKKFKPNSTSQALAKILLRRE